jgi:IclR family KDG regulon transcriptional repressor
LIQSVDRALSILEILKDHPQGLGVTELANRLGVAKSTVHRLLSTLEQYDYVKQSEETLYRLGLKFLEMNEIVVENLDVVEIARPTLKMLSEQVGEIAHLVMLDERDILYIDKVETSSTIRIYSRIGKRAPLHCTGVGKAILAHMNNSSLDRLLDQIDFQSFTQHTICDKAAFKAELEKVSKRGVAFDDEEHELGIRCIAAPIFDHQGEVHYAISITGPINRMSNQRIEELIPFVKEAANQISKQLGYRL